MAGTRGVKYILRLRGDLLRVITKIFPADMDYLTLYPIGDVHYGARECREKQFTDYIQRIKADDHAAVLLVGDLINCGIKSSVTNVYEEKYNVSQQKKGMVDMLRPITDKVVACVRGNHCYRTDKEVGIDAMEDMVDRLELSDIYCKDAGIIKVSLGKKENGKPATYVIYLAHGSGGGQGLGSGISRQDSYQAIIEGLDISVTGHTHKASKTPAARFVFDPRNNRFTERNTMIFVCTAWLDYSGYPERGQLKPAVFYPDTIRLDGRAKTWC